MKQNDKGSKKKTALSTSKRSSNTVLLTFTVTKKN